MQVTYNDIPLYYFTPDEKAGDTKGQAVGGVWWILAPGLSQITPAVAQPSPAASPAAGAAPAAQPSPAAKPAAPGPGSGSSQASRSRVSGSCAGPGPAPGGFAGGPAAHGRYAVRSDPADGWHWRGRCRADGARRSDAPTATQVA